LYWLGVDIGTGGTRALLIDAAGREIAAVTAPHEEIRLDHALWAEQRPENWADAALLAIRGVLVQAGASGSDVRGVGLSGQMHGLVMLDKEGAVIRPALIWCDQRSQPQVDFINRKLGKDRVLEYTANPVLTGFTLPKLLWVQDHEPWNFDRLYKMLLPKDYVRFRLTGEFATEVSDASGTALLDVVHRRWSFEMMDGLGLDRAILPAVYESSDVTGTISQHASELTGLAAGTPVVGGGGDQAAGGVGNGIVKAGIVSCTLGTSGVVFAHTDNAAWDREGRVHTFCHAVRDKWHVMGVTQGAGLSLQWFRNQLARDTSYGELMEEAATAPAGSQGLFWLPYLMGERTPHLDPNARGGWVGLTAKHKRADLIRAIVEGVSYSQKECLEIIEGLGVSVDMVRASGGGARSLLWRQILADVFKRPVTRLETQEGSAYGAALLAMTGTGEFASVPEACAATIREAESINPRTMEAITYAKAYETYRALYPALRPIYARI
jgi:xylulokinase